MKEFEMINEMNGSNIAERKRGVSVLVSGLKINHGLSRTRGANVCAELGRSCFYSCLSCFQLEMGNRKQQGQLGTTTFSGVRANSPAGRSAGRLGRERRGCLHRCSSCFELEKGEGKQQGQLVRTTFRGVRANSPAHWVA